MDFDYQHPVTGALFVNRKEELREVRRRLEGGANLLIVAPRRMGKSSLIHQAFKRASYKGFYVTCPHRATGHDLAEAILHEVTLPLTKRLKEWFVQQVGRYRVRATREPTGAWTFEVVRSETPRRVLADAIHLLDEVARKLDRRVVLAIDEVQRILDRDPDSIHALRDIVQFQGRVGYVLSGSKYHVLQQLLDAEKPFGHQLTPIHMGPIQIDEFRPLARKRFKEHGSQIRDETIDRVGEICRGNPKRIQELFFDLIDVDDPDPSDAERIAINQVETQRHLLEDLLDQVSPGGPMDVLMALAETSGLPPYGHEFVEASAAKSPAHVRSALQSLQRRGLIDPDNTFVDPYLRIYLRSQSISCQDAFA